MKKRMLGILVTVLVLCMMICSASAEGYTYADTISWDGEYDVIVAGFGGAGATAAKNAADAGADVLIVEKAPEGNEGGNTRYCYQLFVDGNGDYEQTYTYFKALGGENEVPDAMVAAYAQKIANMDDFVAEQFGLDQSKFFEWKSILKTLTPEYPEAPGSDTIRLYSIDGSYANGALWNVMKQNVIDRSEKIDVWYASPAKHLIQDPMSKAIIGVQVEREGELLNIRAKNGVVLATGGFENNAEMTETYLGLANPAVIGTLYNTGDGIRMAQEVGAALWHMEVYEGSSIYDVIPAEGEHAAFSRNAALNTGSSFVVGVDGKRFMNEAPTGRHGHVNVGGTWLNPRIPETFFSIMDTANYALALEKGLPSDYAFMYQADTLEELAQKVGIDAGALAATAAQYNEFAANGKDITFGRAANNMAPLSAEGPYYALKLTATILNTQGGPRRNENAEVIGLDGNPIPHLYSAGEMGGICSLHYQGGGNVAETIIFGSIAGINAAAQKEPLPQYVAPIPVASEVRYTIGVEDDTDAAAEIMDLAENEKVGEGLGMGGAVVVKVTFDGEKIVSVEVIAHNETPGICEGAIENIPAAIIEEQSAEVDNVSGATMTSKAIKAAVADCIAQNVK